MVWVPLASTPLRPRLLRHKGCAYRKRIVYGNNPSDDQVVRRKKTSGDQVAHRKKISGDQVVHNKKTSGDKVVHHKKTSGDKVVRHKKPPTPQDKPVDAELGEPQELPTKEDDLGFESF